MNIRQNKITVIPGDGIGPDITKATLSVLNKLNLGLEYDEQLAGEAALNNGLELIPEATIASIQKNKIALKGPITTPVGKGFTSINVQLRKIFDLSANIRPAISFPNASQRYENINIVTMRENTEGLYSLTSSHITEDGQRSEGTFVVTRQGCERILRYAFDYAVKHGRKKVSAIHKANILKDTSGLFLRTASEMAPEYPQIEFNSLIIDNTCMQLVINPHQFDIIVTTNLFGDILSDLCAGLVGGLGLAPGANIGKDTAIFEAVHGSAPDIAGKNIANPTALILAACMMLEHMEHHEAAKKIRSAIVDVMTKRDRLTKDLGGNATTDQYTQALIERL